jgi:phage gpG-like protein
MVDCKLDLRDFEAGLQDARKRGKDLGAVMRAFRPTIMAHLREHFEKREGDTGTWAPRAASSLEAMLPKRAYKKKGGGLTKRYAKRVTNQLGRLKSAFRFHATRTYLEVASIVDWADVQQSGGRAGKGGRSMIPARPFVWASDEIVNLLGSQIVAALIKAYGKH